MHDLNFLQLKSEFETNGFVTIPYEFFSNTPFFRELQKFHNTTCLIETYSAEYVGGSCNVYTKENLEQAKIQCINLYNHSCHEILNKHFPFLSFDFVASYLTLDTIFSSHIAQQSHFDRIPSLKFMLYLNDIHKKNGPFCLSKGSQTWVKENFPKSQRPSFSSTTFFDSTRKIPSQYINSMTPIYGKAGTLIIFDTDCIHHQGIVLSGECRIIRSHFR